MSDQTPFDCRANHKATFDDISPILLEDHLRKTGSKLAKQVRERGVEEILEDMQLLVGPPEVRYIQNITGSVPQMIQATMERFRNLFIREKVIKIPDQMEAL